MRGLAGEAPAPHRPTLQRYISVPADLAGEGARATPTNPTAVYFRACGSRGRGATPTNPYSGIFPCLRISRARAPTPHQPTLQAVYFRACGSRGRGRPRHTNQPLQRYVPVLLGRVLVALGFEHFQSLDQFLAGVARLDHRIHVSA